MAELAEEARLVNDHLAEPIHAAHSLARILAFAATDHLGNYARLFDSQPVPVYSHLVVARACLDACSLAYWLGEPDVGAERRAQRYVAMRLFNAKQQKRSPIGQVKEKAKEILEDARAGVTAAKWPFHPHWSKNENPRVADEAVPRSKAGIAAVLGEIPAEVAETRIGHVLWWYLSGVTHSASFALMQAVELEEPTSELGPHMGAIFTDAKSVLMMAWAISKAYVTMIEAHRGLFRWESDEWNDTRAEHRERSADLREWLKGLP